MSESTTPSSSWHKTNFSIFGNESTGALVDLPSTRKDAKLIGSKFYYTGNPCVNGHLAKRLTTSCACHMCIRQAWGSREEARRKQRGSTEDIHPDARLKIEVMQEDRDLAAALTEVWDE